MLKFGLKQMSNITHIVIGGKGCCSVCIVVAEEAVINNRFDGSCSMYWKICRTTNCLDPSVVVFICCLLFRLFQS